MASATNAADGLKRRSSLSRLSMLPLDMKLAPGIGADIGLISLPLLLHRNASSLASHGEGNCVRGRWVASLASKDDNTIRDPASRLFGGCHCCQSGGES